MLDVADLTIAAISDFLAGYRAIPPADTTEAERADLLRIVRLLDQALTVFGGMGGRRGSGGARSGPHRRGLPCPACTAKRAFSQHSAPTVRMSTPLGPQCCFVLAPPVGVGGQRASEVSHAG